VWKCSDRILPVILARPEIHELTSADNYDSEKISEAIKEAFIELDLELMDSEDRYFYNGATCTCVLLTPHHQFVANLGDSRTIVIKELPKEDTSRRKSGMPKRKRNSIKFSTNDHK